MFDDDALLTMEKGSHQYVIATGPVVHDKEVCIKRASHSIKRGIFQYTLSKEPYVILKNPVVHYKEVCTKRALHSVKRALYLI